MHGSPQMQPTTVTETTFALKDFHELTLMELHDIFHLRDIVFVVGQKITAVSEIDGEDPDCCHAMLRISNSIVGTARIFARKDPIVVGRVAVHTSFQRQGLGTVLMQHVQQWLGERPAELHAQAHLEDWYTQLGWVRYGDIFEEAEIPHVHMKWPRG